MKNYNEKIILENFENIEINGINFKINNEKNILENIENGEQYFTWNKANELFELPTMEYFLEKTKEEFGEPVGYILRERKYLESENMENTEIDYSQEPIYTFYLN